MFREFPETYFPVHLINPESYLIKRCFSSCGNFHLRAAVSRLLFLILGGGRIALLGRKSRSYLRLGEESVFAVVPKLSYRYV